MTHNGRRILSALVAESELGDTCRALALALFGKPTLAYSLVPHPSRAAMDALLQESVLKFTDDRQQAVTWLCPIVKQLAFFVLAQFRQDLDPPPLLTSGHFDMPNIIAKLITYLDPELLREQALKRGTNYALDGLKSALRWTKERRAAVAQSLPQAPREVLFQMELYRLLVAMYGSRYAWKLLPQAAQDTGRPRDQYADLLLEVGDKAAVVLELGVDLNLTDTIVAEVTRTHMHLALTQP
jgi:hypothetical protein